MVTLRRARWLALVGGLLVAPASLAFAQPAPPPAPSSDDLTRARALFEAGGRAYDDAKYDLALQAFEQAYAISPREGLVFSMAQAHRRLFTTTGDANHYDQAVRLYRDYIARVLKGGRRADAVRALEELEARPPAGSRTEPSPTPIPTPGKPPPTGTKPEDKPPPPLPPAKPQVEQTIVYAYSSTPGVLVSLDGAEPKPPDSFVVPPGKHKIKFVAPGYRDHEVDVDVKPGQLVPVSKDLDEKPGRLTIVTTDGADISVDGRFVGQSPLATPLDLSSGRHVVSLQHTGRQTITKAVVLARDDKQTLDVPMETTVQRDISYGFFAASGAAFVGAGVLAGFAIVRHGQATDIDDRRTTESISAEELERYNEVRTDRDVFIAASAATGAGAVALGLVGIGLMLVDPPARPIPPSDEVAPGPEQKPAQPLEIDLAAVAPVLGPSEVGVVALFTF